MTVDAAAVERWARALGVWLNVRGWTEVALSVHPDHVKAGWTISPEASGLVVRFWSRPDHLAAARNDAPLAVDPLTAALLLLGHARGLRVDVGECHACRERGYPRRGSVHATRDGQRRFAARLRACGLTVVESGSHGRYETDGTCSACTIDGTPTGRHTLTWESAIIAAMPRKSGETCRDPQCFPEKGMSCAWGEPSPAKHCPYMLGDAPTREAFAVMADAMQASGDALGDVVTAWLRGECPDCDGAGRILDSSLPRVLVGDVPVDNWVKCSLCWGHGSVLGGFERKLAQTIEAELGRRAA